MRSWLMSLVVVLGICASARIAESANTIWSASASSCTPGQAPSSSYSVVNGALRVIGQAQIFFCPIHHELRQSNGTSNTLTLTYKGNAFYCTGFCPQVPYNTRAILVEMSRSTGAETVVATVSSTSSAAVQSLNTSFSYTFDFDANLYYVRLEVNGVVANPQDVYGVALKDS